MISVCIPTYNGEKFILSQLNSILIQLSEKDEIIISDDSSSDNTINLIKSLKDNRIIISENNKFRSPVYNMENALKLAKGDFIFLADQDDIWEDNKVEEIMKNLQVYNLVISDASIIDQDEKIITESYFNWKKSGKGFWKNFSKNSYIGCAMAFDRKILTASLPFPKKLAMHDVWIGLMAEVFGKVLFLDKKLILYRRHDANLTYSINRTEDKLSDNSLLYKLSYRFIILLNILIRILKSKI